MELDPGPLAEYFDGWYANMTTSPVKDEIQQRHLGLPPHLLSTSALGWEGVAEAVAALRLSAGGTLVDLACGRGGYGLEIAARTGARLIGVDFSAEAVRQAREHARRLGGTADFRVGNLAATGLEAGSATAVLCVDAIQFAAQPQAVYDEIRRRATSLPVGVDVARWFFLERGANTHMDFDLDLAKEKSEKNPVYYVQYAHTRIASILEKSTTVASPLKDFNNPVERELALKIIRYAEILDDSARDYGVQRLTSYAYELAQTFSGFYRDVKVIGSDVLTP